MNKNIENIINELFVNRETCILQLNAIKSNAGECVPNENGKNFHCLCKGSYEVRVSKSFYVTFLFTMHGMLHREPDTIKREEFSALAIFLKFHPHCAVFHLAYLFHKYDRPSAWSIFTPITLSSDHILLEDANGMVEDRGQVAVNGTKIRVFMEIYELIVSDLCDIRAIGHKYYSETKDKPITCCFLIVIYYFMYKYTSEKS